VRIWHIRKTRDRSLCESVLNLKINKPFPTHKTTKIQNQGSTKKGKHKEGGKEISFHKKEGWAKGERE
jgi:hypothetical protein